MNTNTLPATFQPSDATNSLLIEQRGCIDQDASLCLDGSHTNLNRISLSPEEICVDTLPSLIFTDSFRNSSEIAPTDSTDFTNKVSAVYLPAERLSSGNEAMIADGEAQK